MGRKRGGFAGVGRRSKSEDSEPGECYRAIRIVCQEGRRSAQKRWPELRIHALSVDDCGEEFACKEIGIPEWRSARWWVETL